MRKCENEAGERERQTDGRKGLTCMGDLGPTGRSEVEGAAVITP